MITAIDYLESIRETTYDLQRQFEELGIKPSLDDMRQLKHVDEALANIRDFIQEFRQN